MHEASIYKRRIVCLTAGRGLDGRMVGRRRRAQTGCGRRRGRGGGTVRGLGAYLQHGLGVMPGVIAAETGRLSASVPAPCRSSSRLGSGLLITTVVVQAYKEAGQAGRNACRRPKSSQNRAKHDFGSFVLKAQLPSDSLQNGIVNKSLSDECRVLAGLYGTH